MATPEPEELEGCDPKTVAPFEFVVFKTDELVLRVCISTNQSSSISTTKQKKEMKAGGK